MNSSDTPENKPVKSELCGKSRISITAMYSNGVPLMDENEYLADVIQRKTDPAAGQTVLAFVVPSHLASSIKDALQRGEVGLFIEGIPAPNERGS